jgi:hypothetical protein
VTGLRWDLPAADLDQLAHELRRGFGPHLDPILIVEVLPEHAGLLWQIGSITASAELNLLAAAMIEMTAPQGLLDPEKIGNEIPWTRVIVRVSKVDSRCASRVARTWAARLHALQWDNVVVHPVVEAVAHYTVAWAEGINGRPTEARRWSLSAATLTDHEGVAGLSLATWVRAARLLRRS